MASEQNLIKKSMKGDKSAFGKLVNLYQDQILYLAYDYLGNYEEAKDAAQDTFMKAYEKLERYNQKAEFKTWLYRIAINTSIDYLRKRISMQNGQSKIEIDQLENNNIHSENDLWDDYFKDAIKDLSENQCSAVILKYFHSKTTKEIADILECDVNTVRTHLHRGIQKLKQKYKKPDVQ